MNYKKILSWGLLFCILFSLAGCKSGKGSAAFRYYIEEEPKNLDPQTASNSSAFLVIENLYEGLMRVDRDGNITTGAAESFTVDESGLRYTFQLKKDAKWSNEAPVTAHDFVFAFQRLFDPATNAPQAEDFIIIKNARQILNEQRSAEELGIRAEDDYTLTIELERPTPMFLEMLTTAPAMPCLQSFFNETKGKYGISVKTIVSNGPFTLSSWKTDDYVSTQKNEHYRENIQAKSVVYVVEKEDTDLLSDFLDKKSSAVILKGSEYESLSKKDLEVKAYKSVTWGIGFNKNGAYFSDESLRKAFVQSFSKEALRQALGSHYIQAETVVPPIVTMNNQNYMELTGGITIPYDLDAARAYMNQYYTQKGERSIKNIEVIMPDTLNHLEIFQAVAQKWQKELNVFFNIHTMSEEEYTNALAGKGDIVFDIAVISLGLSYNSPMDILSKFYTDSPYNYLHYSSAEFENLCNQAAVEKDPQLIAEYYNQAEQMLVDGSLFLPLYYQNEYFVMAKGVTGLVYLPARQMVQFRYGS